MSVWEFSDVFGAVMRNEDRAKVEQFNLICLATHGDTKQVKSWMERATQWLPSLETKGKPKDFGEAFKDGFK
jgi:hypothetical protein